MMNWKYFFKGFSNIIGSFVLDDKKIESTYDVYAHTSKDIEGAWKTIGNSVNKTLKLYG